MPTVKLYANLRKLAGTKELFIKGVTVEAALNELIEQNPALDGVVLEGGNLRPHVSVALNGHNVIDLATPVKEEDTIAIFPPIAGGTSPPALLLKGEGNRGEGNVWLV